MAVDDEDVMAHTTVEGDDGDDVHPGIAELEGDDCDVRPCILKETGKAFYESHYCYAKREEEEDVC